MTEIPLAIAGQAEFLSSMLHRVEISRSALLHSVKQYRSIIGRSQFYAVVKSNAYGHGLRLCVQILSSEVDGFAVNHISEVEQVYHLTDRPFLVMGRFDEEDACQLLDLDASRITVVLSDIDEIRRLHELRPDLPFHLKIDTGMGRLGRRGAMLDAIFAYLADHPELRWTGIMTHFANVEDVTDQSYAIEQLRLFEEAFKKALAASRGRPLIRHAAASAAALILPQSRLDLVRVGISLYGLWASQATKLSYLSLGRPQLQLRPALRWITKIVHINDLPAESKIGYGCTYQTQRPSRIAVLPVGYHEGYDRRLSNRAYTVIAGRRAPVVGRVCMNMIMVDVTHIPGVRPGMDAVLIGRQEFDGHADEMSADMMADLSGTIHYETTTRIHPDLKRIVVD
jgi:alanine racemase